MAAHNELGKWGEDTAAAFLEEKGYQIIERDWKSGHHDLDIVAKEDNTLVIVEVKTRRSRLFGDPEEAIDRVFSQPLTTTSSPITLVMTYVSTSLVSSAQ